MARTSLLAIHSQTYKRHRPEQTLLYQLIERHYPEFLEQLSRQGKSLPRHVLIQRDMDNTYLELPIDDEDSLLQLQAASVSYRIAVGSDTGKKVFTLQTLPAKDPDNFGQLAKISGFSLHAGVYADSHESDKLERLCRYIARTAISEERLSLTSTGKVRYELKTPYQDGTTHVFFEPLDFMGKLAALVPTPRLNLVRFFGVFAPNARVRAEVTASKRGKNSPKIEEALKDMNKPYHARGMSWAQRPVTGAVKRVFNIDITQCERCTKSNVKIIACITDTFVIKKIIDHLDKIASPITASLPSLLPPLRAPPAGKFDEGEIAQRDFDWGA